MPERADCIRRMLADVLLPVPSNVLIDVSTVLIAPTMDDVPNIQFMLRLVQAKFKGKIAILSTVVGHSIVSYMIAIGISDCRAVFTKQETRDWFAE